MTSIRRRVSALERPNDQPCMSCEMEVLNRAASPTTGADRMMVSRQYGNGQPCAIITRASSRWSSRAWLPIARSVSSRAAASEAAAGTLTLQLRYSLRGGDPPGAGHHLGRLLNQRLVRGCAAVSRPAPRCQRR